MEVSTPDAVKALVAAGVGFSIMSWANVVREVKLGELCKIPLAPRLLRPLSVVYPKERIHSRLINSFLGFAKERIAAMRPVEDAEHTQDHRAGHGADRSAPPKAAARPERASARTAAQLGPRSLR